VAGGRPGTSVGQGVAGLSPSSSWEMKLENRRKRPCSYDAQTFPILKMLAARRWDVFITLARGGRPRATRDTGRNANLGMYPHPDLRRTGHDGYCTGSCKKVRPHAHGPPLLRKRASGCPVRYFFSAGDSGVHLRPANRARLPGRPRRVLLGRLPSQKKIPLNSWKLRGRRNDLESFRRIRTFVHRRFTWTRTEAVARMKGRSAITTGLLPRCPEPYSGCFHVTAHPRIGKDAVYPAGTIVGPFPPDGRFLHRRRRALKIVFLPILQDEFPRGSWDIAGCRRKGVFSHNLVFRQHQEDLPDAGLTKIMHGPSGAWAR